MAARRISARPLLAAGPSALLLFLLLALTLAPAALAVKAPSLASSAQYKAFISYVRKMEERSSQPASTETKDTFEAKLTAKKTAAAHKANALFKRASEEAEAEAEETAKEQVERVRAKEGKELDALQADTAGKLERTEASFHVKFERVATGHRNRERALKEQITGLRGQKSQAAPGAPKAKIQKHIEAVSAEIQANREDEKAKRKQLKGALAAKRHTIEGAAEAKEAEIAEAAEATVKKIDQHWDRAYEEKKAALNTTRENRLGYLEKKLEQGRAAVAAMPPLR